MKTNITYQCEICGQNYTDSSAAFLCEERGRKEPHQVGIMFSGKSYGEHTFATALSEQAGHWIRTDLWVCSDSDKDWLGQSKKTDSGIILPIDFDPAWTLTPHWKRMAAYLIANNIEPLVWCDGKAVKLSERMRGVVA